MTRASGTPVQLHGERYIALHSLCCIACNESELVPWSGRNALWEDEQSQRTTQQWARMYRESLGKGDTMALRYGVRFAPVPRGAVVNARLARILLIRAMVYMRAEPTAMEHIKSAKAKQNRNVDLQPGLVRSEQLVKRWHFGKFCGHAPSVSLSVTDANSVDGT